MALSCAGTSPTPIAGGCCGTPGQLATIAEFTTSARPTACPGTASTIAIAWRGRIKGSPMAVSPRTRRRAVPTGRWGPNTARRHERPLAGDHEGPYGRWTGGPSAAWHITWGHLPIGIYD